MMAMVDEPRAIGRLAEVRGTGEAAGGLIRVSVDGTGDIIELAIEPRAMRLGSQDIAEAVRAAFRAARSAAQARIVGSSADATEAVADLGAVGTELVRLGTAAERRLADFAAVADQVSRRLDRIA
jgi:DNA-binding protein YbaB